ncbi:MAG TPA: YCF48-related protein [Ignavibacteriaceae bacterium]
MPCAFGQSYGDEWDILSSPTDKTLRSLIFTDSSKGWAAGEHGTIIHTTDGGNYWTIQTSNVSTFIHKIFFLNDNLGWALTFKDTPPFGTSILKTTNGGTDWIAEDFPVVNAIIYTIFFFDSSNGFIGGKGLSSAPGNIAYTNDGGNSWLNASIDSNIVYNFPVYNFSFFNRQFGYACGGRIDLAGVLWKTTNYGMNWSAIGISPDEIFDVFVFDSLNAITLSGDPEGFFGIANIKTSDAGNSWHYDSLSITGLSFTIDFRTYGEGWSASGEKFLFTSDRGNSWIEKTFQATKEIWDLQFLDPLTGYAVGDSGIILKLDPLAVTVEQEISSVREFELFQNYPNPFNPTTNIGFRISDFGFVSLTIYDVLGREVAALVNEEKQPGNYETVFDASGHSAGIYFYRLKAGSFVQTKKMVYLK